MMLSLQMICYLIENFNELQEDEAIFDDNFDVVYSNDSSESSKNGIDEKNLRYTRIKTNKTFSNKRSAENEKSAKTRLKAISLLKKMNVLIH